MIRLRCPHNGCSIEVADDRLGARIRCPRCDQFLFADLQYLEGADLELPGQEPAAAPEPAPKPDAPARGEKRLRAGPPPLSLLLGLREGRGSDWGDERAIRAEMTEDDWKALAAFEKVVEAAASLRRTLWYGIPALLVTAFFWWAAAQGASRQATPSAAWGTGWLASLCFCGLGFPLMELGRRQLIRIRLNAQVDLAAWAALFIAVVFLFGTLLSVVPLFGDDRDRFPGMLALLATPFQTLAAFSAGKSCLWVIQSRALLRPPEVVHLLSEALEYLESVPSVRQA
jgi:hypothetical protein